MVKIVATHEFVFKVLKDGVNSYDAGEGTTASRVIRIQNHMTRGTPLGEVARKVGLSLDRVKEVQGWIREFRDLYPEQFSEEKGHHQNWVQEAMVGFIRQIGEKMWVPEPDDIPLDFIDTGSGFRTCVLSGRPFCWEQENGTVVRCWLTDAEEVRLREVIGLMGEHDKEIGDRYQRLQTAAVEYLKKAQRYLWGAYMNGDFVPIPKLRAAMLGGQVVDVSRDAFATSYELMDDLPRLRGLVEEFPRDFEVAIVGFRARSGT